MSAEAKEMHEQKWNLMLQLKYKVSGRRQRGAECPWIFLHDIEYLWYRCSR